MLLHKGQNGVVGVEVVGNYYVTCCVFAPISWQLRCWPTSKGCWDKPIQLRQCSHLFLFTHCPPHNPSRDRHSPLRCPAAPPAIPRRRSGRQYQRLKRRADSCYSEMDSFNFCSSISLAA